MAISLVMPMAGSGSRFKEFTSLPKPLVPVSGLPMFVHAYRSLRNVNRQTIAVVRKENHDEINEAWKNFEIEGNLIAIAPTPNPVQTSLFAKPFLDLDQPIVLLDCDLRFDCPEYLDFLTSWNMESNYDVAFPVFKSNSSKYSYARLNRDHQVLEVQEKCVISPFAIAGAYAFKSSRKFFNFAENGKTYNYVSEVIQEMLRAGLRAKAFPAKEHISFGTPEEIRAL